MPTSFADTISQVRAAHVPHATLLRHPSALQFAPCSSRRITSPSTSALRLLLMPSVNATVTDMTPQVSHASEIVRPRLNSNQLYEFL